VLTAEPSGRALDLSVEADRERYPALAAAAAAHVHRLAPPANLRRLLPEIEPKGVLERAASLGAACGAADVVEACEALSGAEIEEVRPLCVVHGNLDGDCLRCDARGATAVVGWENAALGDPRWDLASAALALRAAGADALVERLYETYAARSEALATESEALVQAMPTWETLCAVQRWSVAEYAHRTRSAGSPASLEETRAGAWRALTRLQHQAASSN
jgi:aminoglycoside phosphotransferase (APT) family kinase protein